jgi:hypothetical protein
MTLKFNPSLLLAILALLGPVALSGRVQAQQSPSVEPPSAAPADAAVNPLEDPTGAPTGAAPTGAAPTGAAPTVAPTTGASAAPTVESAGDSAGNNTASVAFKCIPQGSGFATVVSAGDRNIPIITWNNPQFSPQFTPEKRCQKVSEKFQTAVNKHGAGNLLLTTGLVNKQGVICLVNGGLLGCNPDNILLTLSGANAKDPGVALAKLLNISTTGSGSPIQERQGKQVVPLSTLITQALRSATPASARTQTVPQQPVRQQPGRLF